MPLKMTSITRHDAGKSIGFFANAVSYRIALPVTKIVQFPPRWSSYPICPRCEQSIEREYMHFCDRCGQKLNWDFFFMAKIYVAPINKQVK